MFHHMFNMPSKELWNEHIIVVKIMNTLNIPINSLIFTWTILDDLSRAHDKKELYDPKDDTRNRRKPSQ